MGKMPDAIREVGIQGGGYPASEVKGKVMGMTDIFVILGFVSLK